MQIVDGFKAHLTTLYVFGIFGNFDGIYKFYAVAVLTICYFPYFMYELIIFVGNIDDLDRVGSNYLFISHLGTTLKFVTLIANYKNIAVILEQINSDEFNPYADNHKMFLETQIKQVQNLFKCFIGVANVTIFFMLFWPIIPIGTYDFDPKLNQTLDESINRKSLPFDWSNKQFDVLVSPVYEIAYSGQIQIVFIACQVCVAIDCFVSGLLHMLATQFDILNIEIKRLGNNKMSCAMVHREMEKCVRHHLKLLDISNRMSNTFNGVFFTQCCITSLIMCIAADRMRHVTTMIEFVALLNYILLVIFELYMFCHYGNNIFIKTDEILPAIYHSHWYLRECNCGFNLQQKHLRSFRQGIQIMMERAQYATSLTAAKLFRLNYATFVTILKSGYSFYAVLNSTN